MDLKQRLDDNAEQLRIAMAAQQELRDELTNKRASGGKITQQEDAAYAARIEQVTALLNQSHRLIAELAAT